MDQFRWQGAAACKGVPSYVFFPDERQLPGFKEDAGFAGKTAEDYCANCPVYWICREFAILHDMEGVWAGLTWSQREQLYCKEERFEMRNDKEDMGLYKPLYGH